MVPGISCSSVSDRARSRVGVSRSVFVLRDVVGEREPVAGGEAFIKPQVSGISVAPDSLNSRVIVEEQIRVVRTRKQSGKNSFSCGTDLIGGNDVPGILLSVVIGLVEVGIKDGNLAPCEWISQPQ